jgi:glycosyltransferase involved in cell wall biosynthesis
MRKYEFTNFPKQRTNMSPPTVSVIIPAYNAAAHLGDAIQSVIDQTLTDLEIIVVNDASPDNTTEVIKRFDDPRVKCIIHEKNKGLPATRNTGVRASKGRYIALLDHDDVFHAEKLRKHVEFLEEHYEIGVTYNSRFECAQSIKTIRGIWRAPQTVSLSDFVLGYPFSPSDIVLRREMLLQIGLFDEGNSFHGEDLNTNTRLALSGCQFALIDRALNYRRNHPRRSRPNLDASLKAVLHNLDAVFDDRRCPCEVLELRNLAYANNYLVWAFWSIAQNEVELGRKYLREAVRIKPTILDGDPSELLEFLVMYCIDDEPTDLSGLMKRIFGQLPLEMTAVAKRCHWALARGYLLRGIRDLMWNRPEEADINFSRAAQLHAHLDEALIQSTTYQLLAYENEFGLDATQPVLQKLSLHLGRVAGRRHSSHLKGSYLVNHAFQHYHDGLYSDVVRTVLRTLAADPSYFANRGVISILFRSIGRMIQQASTDSAQLSAIPSQTRSRSSRPLQG